MLTLTIDGREIQADPGEKVLWVALRSGIYIPHLCAMEDGELSFGGCRLCLVEVEVEGKREMVPACGHPVVENMKVYTQTEKIARMRRTAFELIMSDHHIDCKNCAKRKTCELIRISSTLKWSLRPKRLRSLLRDLPADDSHPLFTFDPKKCVKCAKCIRVCQRLGRSFLDFAYRGFEMVLATFDHQPLSSEACEGCTECVKVCPTGALFFKDQGETEDG
ncbi:MAG: 2Fe-2S iron-sulfur cluster-binding protein [Desulfobacterota bacterium]|nr:2Fe-2S iron-sulfur cluster-binding protein [Thermodesulfobacteriota bacterium]